MTSHTELHPDTCKHVFVTILGNHLVIIREGGDIRLFITLVHKVLYSSFLIRWPNNVGDFY